MRGVVEPGEVLIFGAVAGQVHRPEFSVVGEQVGRHFRVVVAGEIHRTQQGVVVERVAHVGDVVVAGVQFVEGGHIGEQVRVEAGEIVPGEVHGIHSGQALEVVTLQVGHAGVGEVYLAGDGGQLVVGDIRAGRIARCRGDDGVLDGLGAVADAVVGGLGLDVVAYDENAGDDSGDDCHSYQGGCWCASDAL